MLMDRSLFNNPLDRIAQTHKKILSFKNLENGWHFGEGIPYIDNIVKKAIILNEEASRHGFIKTNAFPGINGEIQVTIYFSIHCLEFTIEPDEKVTFVYEKDNEEMEYYEDLPFGMAKLKIGEFKENLRNSLGLPVEIKIRGKNRL